MSAAIEFALVPIALFAFIFAIPLFAIWSGHRRQMMELKLRARAETDERTARTIEDLRREVSALRDTTTQYDISFDTALQRLESRLANIETMTLGLENRVRALEAGQSVQTRSAD